MRNGVEPRSNKQQESGQSLQAEGLSVMNWHDQLVVAFSWSRILTRRELPTLCAQAWKCHILPGLNHLSLGWV